jgi:hypothetical protein
LPTAKVAGVGMSDRVVVMSPMVTLTRIDMINFSN